MDLKKVLNISAKQAVNALLVNGAWMTLMGNWHLLSTSQGWKQAGLLTLSTVVAREVAVWVPKLLQWSQTNDN